MGRLTDIFLNIWRQYKLALGTEIKTLSGKMGLDFPEETLPAGFHSEAFNVIFRNGRAENVNGSRAITQALPEGRNKCVGALYDEIKRRLFYCNYNSNNAHGIYIFDTISETVTTIVEIGAGTDGDILEFSPDVYIHSINVLYSGDFDLLCFIDSLRRPTKINIDRALAGDYGVIQRSFIEVIKEPPSEPPVVVYEDDALTKVNNLGKKLFQFATVNRFDDFEKSVLSSFSILPLPHDILLDSTDADSTLNNRISITFQTGKSNIKKIELLGRQSLGNEYGDWFSIKIFDKEDESIADDTTFEYKFYNDAAYNSIDKKYSVLLFDWLPPKANTQELLNGNVLDYGGLTEGLSRITPIITASIGEYLAPI